MIRFLSPLFLLGVPLLGLVAWLGHRQRRSHLALRLLAAAALLVALAEPEIVVREARDVTVFLVDRSASVRRTVTDAEVQRQMEEIIAAHEDWEYGVVAFGGTAVISTRVGETFGGLPTTLGDTIGSRVDKAIDLGLAMLPPNGSNRLILLSDGRLQGAEAAGVAAAQLAGVPVSVLPIGVPATNDVRIASLMAPTETSIGQPFQLTADVIAQEAAPASVAIYQDERLTLYTTANLAPGSNGLSFAAALSSPGSVEYTAVVKRENDPFPENDAQSALVQTTDRPRVLVLDPLGESAVPRLLDSVGIPHLVATKLPPLTTLTQYDQLVLAGVPLDNLTASEATSIELYVTNLGGGLLVFQGQNEVRGLSSSPIDALLPVSFSVPETERDPSLAVVYVLDRSSSMSELVDAKAKIRILREATAASVFLLPPDTLAGVIGFDDTYSWLYPLQRVGDADELYQTLQRLRAGGGTDLFFPIQEAVDALAETTARVKHVLIVSDGKTIGDPRDFPALLADIAQHDDLTVSAIALGEEPNLQLLGELAHAGRGDVYQVVDFRILPQVIVDITQRLGRSRFVTGEVAVTGSLLDGTLGDVPPLGGYVLTHSRDSAGILLEAGEDPIAATWRKGLGSITVFNADLSGLWSAQWLAWPPLSGLFGRLLATTEPRVPATTGLLPSVAVGPDEVTLLVEARTATGGFANFLELDATLLPEEIPQVAPGIYRARFPTPQAGGHAIAVSDTASGRTARLSFSVPYAAEFNALGRDDIALRGIARATGGAVLPQESIERAVRQVAAAAGVPLHSAFAVLALLLFVADVALRKSRFRRVTPPRPNKGPKASSRQE
jgi:Ca-activated chloride channel family protein